MQFFVPINKDKYNLKSTMIKILNVDLLNFVSILKKDLTFCHT